MKIHRFFIQLALVTAMLLFPLAASAISGHYNDPGGGEYWCNVYVSYVSSGKSYSWCTGKGEDSEMNAFRGFESEHNGKITTEYPTILMKFRYRKDQAKDYKYNGSSQEIYVMVHGGSLRKIAEWGKGASTWKQTDFTYGTIDMSMADDWFSFRYAPNDRGLKDVVALQVENETYYHQDNWFQSDYDFRIHARYLKGISMELSQARDATLEWKEPGKMIVSADNSYLPSNIGNNVENFNYSTDYSVVVRAVDDDNVYSRSVFCAENRGSCSTEVAVPLDKNFTVSVTSNTSTSFRFKGTNMTQNLHENREVVHNFSNNQFNSLTASPNQVEGTMYLAWEGGGLSNEGEFQIYRTELDEHGNYRGNRELVGTTRGWDFTDNSSRGLEYAKYYRYEVFKLFDSWGELNIPSNPEPLTVVHAAEVRTSTVPVIPLHLIQDATVTDNIKFDWTFGNIPKTENDITFRVHRIEPNGTITRNYLMVDVPRTAGKASFVDEKPESNCSVYGYFLQLDLSDNKVHLYSDTIQAHVLDGTTVTSLNVTKGTAGNTVIVKWKARQVGTKATQFDIQRRFIGSGEWVSIYEQEGTASSYSYTDNTAEPGRYYEYRVVAYAQDCEGDSRVISNAMTDVGFSQATGVVSGRVQFETGTAVDNVYITLSRESDESMRLPYYSRHIVDNGGGLTWQTDTATANKMLRLDKPFTIQMWINPDEYIGGAYLFKIVGYDGFYGYISDDETDQRDGYSFKLRSYGGNEYLITMDYADADGRNRKMQFDNIPKIPAGKYSHITFRNNGNGIVDCIVNGDCDAMQSSENLNFKRDRITGTDGKADVMFTTGGYYDGVMDDKCYKGYVDEVRLWNRALTNDEITGNFNRILSGREDGLKIYWNFDEGLEEYAFDCSTTNGVPNSNHPILGVTTRPSNIVPSEKQLSAYAITNTKGEYEIRGIPFAGSGTRYSVYPSKGIHSFSPTNRTAFIGGTSLNINNVDFTDVSSFRVSGTIRYAGTTIPVDSVSFFVDGIPCNKNDKVIYTDKNGEYEISVPIGSHYIEARRQGHTFVGGGRYPAEEGETYEFLNETHIDFFDNTLVTFAGRVTGGATEGGKPLGYGVSENTIGQAVIALTPLDHPQRMLNAMQQVNGTTVEWVPNPDDVEIEGASTDINSSAYRAGGTVDDVKYIYITTDENTGEFSAMVPPIRYMVHSVKFPHNQELERDELFLNVPAVNLSNPTDTIIPDTIYTDSHEPLPLFKCNRKLMLTYRTNPVIDITQMGLPAGAFGTDTIAVRDAGVDYRLPIFTYDEATQQATYIYGYPIFQMGRSYDFKVRAYEPYLNYDKSATGKLYKDMLRDSVVTFGNELGEAALIVAEDNVVDGHEVKRGDMAKLDPEQVKLNEEGEGHYKWRAGIPSLTAPFTRNMNASMVINGQTKLWSNDGLTAIIAGVVPTGNNFITAGPSRVQMVLRDPPGDASSATWATDSVTSDYTYTVRGIHNNTEIGVDVRVSADFDFIAGTAFFGKLTYNSIIHENAGLYKYEVNKTWDNHTFVTYTNSQSISTSSSNKYVGRDGDVFIGYSTNYIIGAADKVGIFRQNDGSWGVSMQETMSMDENFNTHFEYSQKYIETTLFDNIKRTRNTKLKHINSLSEIEENPEVPTYYTFFTEDDPKYGSSNNDEKIWGPDAKEGFEGPSYYARFPDGYEGCDSVNWCNEIIKSWIKTLSDNEEDKVKAFNDNTKKIGNESFETGSSVTNSAGKTTKTVDNSTEVFSTGLAYRGKNGFLLDKMGAIIISNTDIGYHQTKYDVDETTTTKRFSYTLNDTQRGNAHTVDIFESPKGWSTIFRTRGGQTRCPYEGETRTKYYQEGTLLDYATMMSDNPHISMPVRNFVDIPAGQEAQVEIKLTNESQTHEAFTSVVLYVLPASNPDGLQIFMDGEPLVNGTELWVEYNVPLVKTLTIRQSNNAVLDYNDITLRIASSCNPSAWVFDEVSFSAHFVPAAPDVTLKLNKNILNQRDVLSGDQVIATISDINRLFTGFKGVRLKYRFAGDTRWITAHEWFSSPEYLAEGHETAEQSLMPTDKPNISYDLLLPDIDGHYMVAAESMCILGQKEYTAMTDEIEVIRDTRGPKLLGQAYPNTGILTPTDDIHIKFNEDIRESYLTKESNFFITGALNDAQVSHDVSLQFNGNPVETDAYLPISNTSFASTLWLKRKSGGTIIEHGTEGNMLKVAINNQGQVEASINGTKVTSQESIPADKWVFLAINYVKGSNGSDNTLTMLMAQGADETMLFDEAIMPDYNSNGRLTLGRDFTGMMHELVLWNKNCPVRTLLAQKDEVVAPYLPGLVGYWKMNEGHGTTVTDYARSRNIHLPVESWNIENTNLAAHLDGEHTIKIPISKISPRPTDSYVVETWFRGEKDKNARATLFSVTDRMSIGFDYDNSMILHIYNDSLPSYTTNGLPIVVSNVNYNDGNWHHLALNVHRGVSAVVYIDGKAVKTLAEQQLPAPAGDNLYVGSILKRVNAQLAPVESYKFTGDIDELRIWNVACDGTSIIANRYNQIDTAHVTGLVAYYPMQRNVLDANNNIVTEFSLDNIAPLAIEYGTGATIADGVTQAITAPALRKAPLWQNLDFDFTASSDEIYININTLPSRMQGNLLTFTVKNVRDLCDNLSETITWSAQVDYNTLEWDTDELAVEKDRLSECVATAVLQNKGRESGRFNITGLPTWIEPSVVTGVLGINESILVQFTIGANAPVGTHNIYAYAVNDADICAPLMLHINVTGNDPMWDINPDDYESSMNVIGQIYFEDKICVNPNTKIAAFVDGECCGVASPKLMTSRDAYFVSMTIYGLEDTTKTQPITFRIYDAEQGVVFGNVKTMLNGQILNPVYQPNGLMGDYDNPVIWQPTDQIDQLCSLKTGWNWISLYVKPEEGKDDLESVFGHAKVFNTIKGKDGFAMNSGTKWVSTGLETVDVGKLYKMKVKNDVNHNIVGTLIDTRTTTQTIHPGWNWIGPLSIYNLSLNEAFADLQPTRGDIVKSKNQVAFYDGYKWEGDLTALIPGMGYYYKSNNDQVLNFRYPTIDADYNQTPAVLMRAPASMPFTPVDHYQFSDNMNVVARIVNGDVAVDDLCLAAFVDGECRGATYATSDGLYLLTIAGNADEAGKTVRFATMYDGEIVWFAEKLSWICDWIYGDLDNPQLLRLESVGIHEVTSQSSIIITPTLVTDVINVSADDNLKSVDIYSVNGKKLHSFTLNENHATLDLSDLISGVYFVEARTCSGARKVEQIIKR